MFISHLPKISCALFCLFLLVSPQASPAAEKKDVFKSSEFLTWEKKSQDFYLETSVGMTGLIVQRNNKEQSQCLEKWYFSDKEQKNQIILDAMRKHSDFHPRGIILAVLEKQCGSFVYTK